MSETPQTIVICYDISRSTTRRRVSNLLEEQMVRVQKSVFESQMKMNAADYLFKLVERLLDDGDRARMYVLTQQGLSKSKSAGGTPLPEDGAFWLL